VATIVIGGHFARVGKTVGAELIPHCANTIWTAVKITHTGMEFAPQLERPATARRRITVGRNRKKETARASRIPPVFCGWGGARAVGSRTEQGRLRNDARARKRLEPVRSM